MLKCGLESDALLTVSVRPNAVLQTLPSVGQTPCHTIQLRRRPAAVRNMEADFEFMRGRSYGFSAAVAFVGFDILGHSTPLAVKRWSAVGPRLAPRPPALFLVAVLGFERFYSSPERSRPRDGRRRECFFLRLFRFAIASALVLGHVQPPSRYEERERLSSAAAPATHLLASAAAVDGV